MAWVALFAGVFGFVVAYFPHYSVQLSYSPYISLAALAGIDSLIGGVRAAQEGKFKGSVFLSGFVANTLLAAFLAYLGNCLGQPLALAAVVALGGRIFVNLSIIRREWMDKLGEEAAARRALHPTP